VALDWLPIDARPPRLRQPKRGEILCPFTAKTIPVPDILANLTFLPVDARPPKLRQPLRTTYLLPPTAPSFAPVSWLTSVDYPAKSTRQRQPSVAEPPPGAQVVVAQQMAWLPLASPRPHQTPPPHGETLEILFPGIPAAGVPCAHLEDGSFTATTFLDEALTSTGFLNEAVTTTTFIGEEVC
jgi:hypothetical protein